MVSLGKQKISVLCVLYVADGKNILSPKVPIATNVTFCFDLTKTFEHAVSSLLVHVDTVCRWCTPVPAKQEKIALERICGLRRRGSCRNDEGGRHMVSRLGSNGGSTYSRGSYVVCRPVPELLPDTHLFQRSLQRRFWILIIFWFYCGLFSCWK
jgi:hypothetical protein